MSAAWLPGITPGQVDMVPGPAVITVGQVDISPGPAVTIAGRVDISPGLAVITAGQADISPGPVEPAHSHELNPLSSSKCSNGDGLCCAIAVTRHRCFLV